MSKQEVLKLIESKESQTLEFKPSLSNLNEIVKSLCGFANTKGGRILVGVSNAGRITGVNIGKDTIERLTNKITGNTEPKLYPHIWVEPIKNKQIIIIEVKEARDKPVLAFGRAYKRIGKSTLKVSKDEYEQIILEKHKERLQFDSEVCKEAGLKDLDEDKIRWFLKKAKHERNLEIDPSVSVKEALERLKLIQDGKLTNAAILMFGKEPQRFFLQSEVRCARFKGTKPVKPFIDMKVVSGTVYEQIDQAEKFVLFNIKKEVWVEPGKIERQERWEYPPDALREAITNAVCHRDYFSNASVQIRIFDDRIEIWNPGTLPEGLTVEDLKGKHESKPRNKLIARLFFLIKYIEEWGTGTNEMIKLCLDHKLPEPELEETAGSFVVTFMKSKLTEEFLDSLELNERQRKAIEYIKEKGRITNKEYREMFGIGKTVAYEDIKYLLNKKLLSQRGIGRQIYYVLR
jgi:ATP-dependent DNA helicase RecG